MEACDYRSTINNQSCFSVSRTPGALMRPLKTAEEFRAAVDEMLKGEVFLVLLYEPEGP